MRCELFILFVFLGLAKWSTAQENRLRFVLHANMNGGIGHRIVQQDRQIMKPVFYTKEESGDGTTYSPIIKGYAIGAGLAYSWNENRHTIELGYQRSLSTYSFELYEPYQFYFPPENQDVFMWHTWTEYDLYKIRWQQLSKETGFYWALSSGVLIRANESRLTDKEGMHHLVENQYTVSGGSYTGGIWWEITNPRSLGYFAAPEVGWNYITERGHSISLGFTYTRAFRSQMRMDYRHYENGNVVAQGTYDVFGSNYSLDLRYGLPITTISWKRPLPIPAPTIVDRGLDPDKYDPINLTVLLDISGSMSGTEMQAVRSGMLQLIDSLGSIDRFSLLTFNNKTRVISKGAPISPENRPKLKKQIQELHASGSTHGIAGLDKAYVQAERAYLPNGKNHVIIITDGGFNDPDYSKEKLWNLVANKYLEEGIHLSIIGINNGTLIE